MVTFRSKRAKERQGLESYLELTRKQRARLLAKDNFKRQLTAVLDLRKHKHERDNSIYITHTGWQVLKSEARSRRYRLSGLSAGLNRVFPGAINVPSGYDAREPDSFRLKDIKEAWKEGRAAVYWVDGSCQNGFLGAGVVWETDRHYYLASYKLGRDVGDNADAEVFAIAAGLGRAKKEVKGGKKIELVRIFSDAMDILQTIGEGTCSTLGPMLKQRMTLEALYERAEWLTAQGICVELVWVKGHSNSKGNELADRAASRAASKQLALFGANRDNTKVMTQVDVPMKWKELGQDWVDEWLWRANNRLYIYPTKREEWVMVVREWEYQVANELDKIDEVSEVDEVDERPEEDTVSNWSDDGHTHEPDEISSLDQRIITALRAKVKSRRKNRNGLRPGFTKRDQQMQQIISELHQKDTDQLPDQEDLWRKFEENFGPQREISYRKSRAIAQDESLEEHWVGDALLSLLEPTAGAGDAE